MLKEEYFAMIKILVEGNRDENDEKILRKGGCHYLLGQLLRQYEIPEDHYFISDAAMKKWNEITSDSIWKYRYRDSVKCKNDNVKAKKYVGASNQPTGDSDKDGYSPLEKGVNFCFRDVFHDEHIVAITDIIAELVRLDEEGMLNNKKIEDTLNQIYICRMLKEEDKKIKGKYHRGKDYKEIIQKYYNVVGIAVQSRKSNELA